MKNITLTVLAGIIMLLAANSCCKNDSAYNHTNIPPGDTDNIFMHAAAGIHHAQLDAGAMAIEGTHSLVQAHGQIMILWHTKAWNELQNIANAWSIRLPDGPHTEHFVFKQQLSALQGRAFDSVYLHIQLSYHDKAISLFQNQVTNGIHNDVLSYANKYLPLLQQHRQSLDSIMTAMDF